MSVWSTINVIGRTIQTPAGCNYSVIIYYIVIISHPSVVHPKASVCFNLLRIRVLFLMKFLRLFFITKVKKIYVPKKLQHKIYLVLEYST